MNKQCYRVVFNKARGMLMVVSEIAKSQNKSVSNSSRQKRANDNRSEFSPKYKKLVMAVICAQSLVYQQLAWAANTQIQNKSSSIPSSQRALLLKASNGTPIVNIRTPNSKGLSHNSYTQFNIGDNHVVLNNSINGANTRLAGNINGNQYLAKGVAGTILNEVRSSAPSYLKGNIEVAGQKADVIIANPSGIQIQGGGFINANRATLTTGVPIKNKSGELTGFNVAKGVVTLNPTADNNDALGQAGVNETRTNYVDIYARAIDLNGQVYSHKGVDLFAGSNQVDYTTGATKTISPQGTKPQFAIDVSSLGGIYSGGLISLVGTEKGLGVNNAGQISSNRAVHLSNNGNITNTGKIQTNNYPFTAISMNAKGNIDNEGKLYGYGLIDLKATGDINHKNAIVRQFRSNKNIYAPQVINMDAGRYLKIDENSDIRNYTASDSSNINLHADTDVYITNKSIVASNGGINIDADRYVRLRSDGYVSSKKSTNIHSDNGTLVDKAKVYSSQGNVTLSAGDNTDSLASDVYVQNNSVLKAVTGDVKLIGERHAVIKSGSQVYQAENVNLYAGGTALIDNARKINATQNVTLDADGYAYIKNSKTDFTVGKQLTMSGNQASVIGSNITADKGISVNSYNKQLTIGTSNLTSEDGAVAAIAYNSNVNLAKVNINGNSTILAAKKELNMSSSNIDTDAATIQSDEDIYLKDLDVDSKTSTEAGTLNITSKGATKINDSDIDFKGNIKTNSNNHLSLINTNIKSNKNLSLQSNKRIYNNVNREKDKNGKYIINYDINQKQNNLTAGEMLTLKSGWWQYNNDANLTGTSVFIDSGTGNSFAGDLNIKATGVDKDVSSRVRGDVQIVNKKGINLNKYDNIQASHDLIMQSDQTINLDKVQDISANRIQLKTLKSSIAVNKEGIKNTSGLGDINIKGTVLTAKSSGKNGIVMDSAGYAKVENSKLKTNGDAVLKSKLLMQINNSTVDAGGNLVIDSDHQLITNGKRKAGTNSSLEHVTGKTSLEADKVLSIESRYTQAFQDTDIKGGAVLMNSGSYLRLNPKTTVTAQANSKLGADKSAMTTTNKTARSSLNGDLSISGAKSITIDPKKVNLKANGDVHLSSREGTLTLKGHAGKSGLGSETVVKLKTAGNINLTGKDVVVDGADLTSSKKGVNIIATDGDVQLKGVKDSFTQKVTDYNINTLKEQQQLAQANIKKTSQPISFNQLLDWIEYHENEYDRALEDWRDCRLNRKCSDEASHRKKHHYDMKRSLMRSDAYQGYDRKKKEVKASPINVYEAISDRVKYYDSQYDIASDNRFDCHGFDCREKYHQEMHDYNDLKRNLLNSNEYKTSKKAQKDMVKAEALLSNINSIITATKKKRTGYEHKDINLTVKRNVNIIANGGGILLEATDIKADAINIKANGNLKSKESIKITGLNDVYTQGSVRDGKIIGDDYSLHQLVNNAELRASKDIKIAGNGKLSQKGNNNAVTLNSTKINTKGNVNIDAIKGALILDYGTQSFQDGSHDYEKKSRLGGLLGSKKTHTWETYENVSPVTTDITANNIKLKSDGHIKIYSSELTAGKKGDVDIEAGKGLYLYAVNDINKYTTEKKTSSRFFVFNSKGSSHDSSSRVTQLPTTLIGGKAYTKSGGDTLLQGTVFDTLKPADIQVGVGNYADKEAKLILEPIAKQVTTTHTQEKESLVWQKQVNSGSVVTTADMPKFNQIPKISTTNGVEITVPVEVTVKDNEKAKTRILSQNELGKIAVELSKEPGYEYLADLDKRNDINWQQVELIQKNWDYEQEGLTAAGAALLALAVAWAAGPAAGAIADSFGGIAGAAASAGFTSVTTQASIVLVNNKGDLSKTLDDLASSDTVRAALTAALTAGTLEYINTQVMPGVLDKLNIENPKSLEGKLISAGLEGTGSALVDAAVNGGSLEDKLKVALLVSGVDAIHGSAAGLIKKTEHDYIIHKVLHAAAGCAAAAAKQSECEAGAIGAAIGEIVAELIPDPDSESSYEKYKQAIETQKFVSNFLAGTIAGFAGYDTQTAINSANIAVSNNRQFLPRERLRIKKIAQETGYTEKDLYIAGCALIRCSSHLPTDTVEFKLARAIEIEGNKPKYSSMRRKLSEQYYIKKSITITRDDYTVKTTEPMFRPNSVKDFVGKYSIGTRVGGGFKIVGGVVGGGASGAGLVSCATGVGCALAGLGLTYSADLASTGVKQMWSGKSENTLGSEALHRAFGIPVEQAELIYGTVGLAGEISAIRSGLISAANAGKVTLSRECFTAGTPVNTKQGHQAIETLTVGKTVSFSELTK